MDSSMSASPPHAALLRAATELDKSWSAEKFAPSVTVPLIELALAHYALLDKRAKVRLILAAGCLIKSQRAAMTSAVTTFVHRALDDDEEWVRTTARLIGGGIFKIEAAQQAPLPGLEREVVARLAEQASAPLVSALMLPDESLYMYPSHENVAKPHFTTVEGPAREAQQRRLEQAIKVDQVVKSTVPTAENMEGWNANRVNRVMTPADDGGGGSLFVPKEHTSRRPSMRVDDTGGSAIVAAAMSVTFSKPGRNLVSLQ